MSHLIPPRLVPIALAAALLPLPACASPFARTPKPPEACPRIEGVAYSFTPETQHEFRLDGLERVEQKQPTWCWAACAEMVSNWRGGGTTQDDFVQRILELSDGSEESEQAATRHEILLALAPARKDDIERLWTELILRAAAAEAAKHYAASEEEREYYEQVQLEVALRAATVGLAQLDDTVDLDTALADLQDGEPVVVGLTEMGADGKPFGHACVLVGLRASYSGPRNPLTDVGDALLGTAPKVEGVKAPSGYNFLEATLIDPNPEVEDGLRTMPAAELVAKATFFASRPFAEKFLEKEVELLTPQL